MKTPMMSDLIERVASEESGLGRRYLLSVLRDALSKTGPVHHGTSTYRATDDAIWETQMVIPDGTPRAEETPVPVGILREP